MKVLVGILAIFALLWLHGQWVDHETRETFQPVFNEMQGETRDLMTWEDLIPKPVEVICMNDSGQRIRCEDISQLEPEYLNLTKVKEFVTDWSGCDRKWNHDIVDATSICQPRIEEMEWVIRHLQRNLEWVKQMNGVE